MLKIRDQMSPPVCTRQFCLMQISQHFPDRKNNLAPTRVNHHLSPAHRFQPWRVARRRDRLTDHGLLLLTDNCSLTTTDFAVVLSQ